MLAVHSDDVSYSYLYNHYNKIVITLKLRDGKTDHSNSFCFDPSKVGQDGVTY